jgi:transcription initiation factor TFIID subunit TAF12
LGVWLINKLLFGELYGGDDEAGSSINDARRRQQQYNQYQQYQQFQQREYERQKHRYEDGPVIIEKADATLVKPRKKAIGDYGEYVEFREVEE